MQSQQNLKSWKTKPNKIKKKTHIERDTMDGMINKMFAIIVLKLSSEMLYLLACSNWILKCNLLCWTWIAHGHVKVIYLCNPVKCTKQCNRVWDLSWLHQSTTTLSIWWILFCMVGMWMMIFRMLEHRFYLWLESYF